MKILSAEQIREADKYTIEKEPVSSVDLMERAAAAFTRIYLSYFPPSYPVKIFCGIGNNGGDGLVIARMLSLRHYNVKIYIVRYADKTSQDFKVNFERLKKWDIPVEDISQNSPMPALHSGDIVIDALWGSGLNRPIEGFAVDVIKYINGSEAAAVVAVDMPSGIFADKPFTGTAIEADLTITFQTPKLALFFPEYYRNVGDWEIADIGLDREFIENISTDIYFTDVEQIGNIYRQREKFSHKGTFGHALIIGGSYGKIGAAVLSATACLKMGAGMVTAYIPRCGYQIMQTALPEAMVITGEKETILAEMAFDRDKFDVIGIGPGMGTDQETQEAFHKLLKSLKEPIVIDADGLNILAENKEWLKEVPENSIFTPHPKEFERLVGKAENSFEQMEMAKNFARENKIYLVLKGSHTMTVAPDGKIYFNPEGNPGMGTAGSGDVLTGMLISLLAQGYEPEKACIIGIYIHALAGNIAAADSSMETMTSMDITKYIHYAYDHIISKA